jgi:uncharacterized membrane protein YphA (DoxX/SURF4 family)
MRSGSPTRTPEILLGLLLVFGWKTRIAALLSGVLLTGNEAVSE